jgi:hypothetical protein
MARIATTHDCNRRLNGKIVGQALHFVAASPISPIPQAIALVGACG